MTAQKEIQGLRAKYDKLKKENDFLKREILLIEEAREKTYKETIDRAVDLNALRSNHPE